MNLMQPSSVNLCNGCRNPQASKVGGSGLVGCNAVPEGVLDAHAWHGRLAAGQLASGCKMP
jgi:hypothetical protein